VDLLNGQNQLFNGFISLISAQSVAIFADYQLLAAMGNLIEYVKQPPPADAIPLEVEPFGLFPTKLPPIILHDPMTGPEPLPVKRAEPVPALNYASAGRDGFATQGDTFANRWQGSNPAQELIDTASKWPVR